MSKSIKTNNSLVKGVGVKPSMKSPTSKTPHSLNPGSYALDIFHNSKAFDSFLNAIIGFGTNKDKAAQGQFIPQPPLKISELEAIYQNQWYAKVIDIKVYEMLRSGWTIKCPELAPADINRIQKEERRLKVKKNLRRSLTDAAIYGGSSIFAKFNDEDHDKPITYESIKGHRIQHLLSYDKNNMPVVGGLDFDPMSANYLQPLHFTIAGSADQIHHSRVITFPWFELPLNIRRRTNVYWGDSELTRPYNAILNSETITSAISNLVCDANLDIYKIPGLTSMLKNSAEERNLQARMIAVNICKSILNGIAIDGNESLEQRVRSFTGLPELFDKFIYILCSASEIPKIRFMCENVSGLGSNGESGLENFYTYINEIQENRLLDQLYKIYNLICATLFGRVFEDFTIEFNPLWSESKKEKAEREGLELDNLSKQEALGIPRYMLLQEAKKKGLNSSLTDEYIEQVRLSETNADIEPLEEGEGDAI